MSVQIQKLEQEIDLGRKRLTSDRMDISFGEILSMYKSKELIIQPEYQRLYRWNNTQKTALIESLLLSIPIPPIFVAEDENGIWEIVDGLQRITTFISFFGELEKDFSVISQEDDSSEIHPENELKQFDQNAEFRNGNKWTLESGSIVESLSGFNIDNLPKSLQINLKRSVCRVEILRGESQQEMKYELFKRLNSGGSKLTPQEIRNAIYRGTDPRLNELLLHLSQYPLFQDMTGLSDKNKQELYDQELILRFLAFFDDINNINENTEIYLNKFMEKTVETQKYDYEYMGELFKETLELINKNVNNPREVFRNKSSNKKFVPVFFEGIMLGVAKNIDKFRSNPELIDEKISLLKQDEDFRRYSGSMSNSKSRIKNRLRRMYEIFGIED